MRKKIIGILICILSLVANISSVVTGNSKANAELITDLDDILIGTITVTNDNVRVKCLEKIYETKSKDSVNINFRVDYEMVGYGGMSCGMYIKSWEEKNVEVTKPSNWDRDDGIIKLEMEVEPKDSYTIVIWGTNGNDYDECDAIVEVKYGRGKDTIIFGLTFLEQVLEHLIQYFPFFGKILNQILI